MKHLRITVEGKTYDVTVEQFDAPESAAAMTPPAPAKVVASPAAPVILPQAPPKPTAAAGDILSPLAGVVKNIAAAVGTAVKAGDSVMTLEAMKMYTSINAPADGTVTAVHVNPGDAVDEGQPLYTLS